MTHKGWCVIKPQHNQWTDINIFPQPLYFSFASVTSSAVNFLPFCGRGRAQVAKWLVLPGSGPPVLGSIPTGGGIQLMTVWHFITQNLSLSPFDHLDMTNNVERDVKH